LIRRGFLDQQGNQVATAELARQLALSDGGMRVAASVLEAAPKPTPQSGRKCPDCGAYALHQVDGCSHCSECHYIGSCG
jgi:ribonucleoside-diphosphate reductase alpha chain